MNMKTIFLSTAAALASMTGAQAADLPVKAKAVEYVRVCSLYGAGFFYIPGTDTCLKIGGFVRVDNVVNGGGSHSQFYNGNGGTKTRLQDDYVSRARAVVTWDVRTQTEYGTLRAYISAGWQYTSGTDSYASATAYGDQWFIQFAGFTFGRAYSFFAMPWNTYGANYAAALLGGTDGSTYLRNMIAYTAQFGNGVSGSIALEDAGLTPTFVYNATNALGAPGVSPTNSTAGGTFPDIVGNMQVDQAWGSAKISGLAHLVRANYYGTSETTGHPGDKWGFAVEGGLKLNLPWATGDNVTVSAIYTEGALRTLFAGLASTNSIGIYSGGSVMFAQAFDAVFQGASAASGQSLELTKGWGLNASLTHYWTPALRTGVFGSYTSIDYNQNATNYICASPATNITLTGGSPNSCNPDWDVWQIGTRTMWSPVANLDIGLEVLYSKFQTNYGPAFNIVANGAKPAAIYTSSDQDVFSGILRVQRNFWP